MMTSSRDAVNSVIANIAAQGRRNFEPARDPVCHPNFVGDDGLLHCGICGQRKQIRVLILGREMVMPVICQCRQEELEEAKRREQYQQEMDRIDRLRSASLMSKLYRDATFDHYKIRPENETIYRVATRYADRFDEMLARNQGLLIYGDVGTGKSYTAACIANALLAKSIPVVMTSFVKILQDIQTGRRDEASYLRILDHAKLLILDGLGAERSTDYALEKVYNVVDSRVRANLPMILTTNLTLKDIKEQPDIRYRRIYDRILETCYPVQVTGTSFRLASAARRMDEMQPLTED